ncbi:MAG: hypothetical protein KJ645_01325, partial [Planctomycetes bacterium]|nr:hypothetical protein [Planctomycetota bacterium]
MHRRKRMGIKFSNFRKPLLIGFIALFAFFHLIPLQSRADIIHLKDGGAMAGEIIEEKPDWIRIKTSHGTVKIVRDRILKIEKSVSDESLYREMVKNLDKNDPNALL